MTPGATSTIAEGFKAREVLAVELRVAALEAELREARALLQTLHETPALEVLAVLDGFRDTDLGCVHMSDQANDAGVDGASGCVHMSGGAP